MNESERLKILTKEIEDILKSQLNIQNTRNTYHTYRNHCLCFIQWAVKNHQCTTLTGARNHVQPWLQSRAKLSENTRRVDANALAKLYSEARQRFYLDSSQMQSMDIEPLRHFCKATGLVKHELAYLKKDCLLYFNDQCFIRLELPDELRIIPIVENSEILTQYISGCNVVRLWTVLPDSLDYEKFRTRYMAKLYKRQARSVQKVSENEQYPLHDKKKIFDKRALFEVALSTGIYDYNILAQRINAYFEKQNSKTSKLP